MNIMKHTFMGYLDKLYNKNKLLYEIIGYLFGGGTAAFADFISLFFLTSYIGIWYWYSAAISFIIGSIINYSINKKLTFKNKYKKIHVQYLLFVVIAFTSLIWNQIIMYVGVEYVHLHYLVAKIISLGLVFIWSFTMHKKITYGILR